MGHHTAAGTVPGYLTTRQLSRRWGVTPKTLANWRTSASACGGPPWQRERSGRILYPLDSVVEFERSGTSRSAKYLKVHQLRLQKEVDGPDDIPVSCTSSDSGNSAEPPAN